MGTLLAISCITALELANMRWLHHNGKVLTLTITVVAGLGGYTFGEVV